MNRRLWLTVALSLVLVATFGQAYTQHFRNALNPGFFTDDARNQIWPLHRYVTPERFQNDYIGQYIFDTLPFGFRMVYRSLAPIWNPERVSKILPYVLLVVSLIFLGLATWKLGGYGPLWLSLFLGLGSSRLMFLAVGGLPRAFGIPVICMALYALATGRIYLLALSVVLGSLFYPLVAIAPGIALAGVLFVLPARCRGSGCGWTVKKRIVVLFVTGFLTVLAALPCAFYSPQYGKKIRPVEFEKYPEIPGRLIASDLPPYKTYSEGFLHFGRMGILCDGIPWSEWIRGKISGDEYDHQIRIIDHILGILMITSLVGFAVTCVHSSAGRRIAMLLVASILSFLMALAVYPYFYVPERYIEYVAVPLMIVLLSVALFELPNHLPDRSRYRVWIRGASSLVAVAVVLLIGGRGPTKDFSYTIQLNPDLRIYDFLRDLPDDALIAGWPDYDLTDNIPYVCRRPIFLSRETLATYHEGYVLKYRERMNALVDAYLATDTEPLKVLSEQFGVTHLVVDLKYFHGHPLFFVEPYNQRITKQLSKIQDDQPEILRQIPHAGVFSENKKVVLDLSKIVSSSTTQPESTEQSS